MKVKYVGPEQSVWLKESDQVVESGGEVDLPAEVVKELVGTGEWVKPGKSEPSGEEEK